MNKLLKWLGIAAGSLVGIFLLTGLIVYFFLPLNTIKDFATSKLSEQLHRDVKIKGVSFNLLSGIKLTDVTISNGIGFSKTPIISAKALELKYAFWPLFRGKVVIPEINFVNPEILVEKNQNGKFNFTDMLGAKTTTTKKGKTTDTKPTKSNITNIDLIVNNFRISNGKMIYRDYYTGDMGLKNVNLSVSNITLIALKPIDISFQAIGIYLGKEMPISLNTKIGIDINGNTISVKDTALTIAGDTLNINADGKYLQTAPQITVSAKSDKITLDPFLALFAGTAPVSTKKEATPHGALTKSLQKTFSSLPQNLTVSADLDLKNIILKTLKINSLSLTAGINNKKVTLDVKYFTAYKGKCYVKGAKFDLPSLSYSIDKFEIHGFSATPFINDSIDSFIPAMIDLKNNVEGTLDLSLSIKGAGAEMPEAFDNLKASGVMLLSKGRLKKIKSLASIGEQYGINMLKNDMLVDGLRINASISKKILTVSKLSLSQTDLQTEFTGNLDFNKMEYQSGNRLSLKFSPAVTSSLPKEFALLKDDKGMTTIEFELQGSLYKPIPAPRFEKSLESAVGNLKVKIEAKKVEIIKQGQQELNKAASSLETQTKQQLQEEAKKKVKEIFKF